MNTGIFASSDARKENVSDLPLVPDYGSGPFRMCEGV